MKMSLGILIGIFLVLAGISLILKIIFNIDLPVFRIVFALFLIYIGIRLLSPGPAFKGIHWDKPTVLFSETYLKGIPEDGEYNIIFGKAVIDLQEETFHETTHLEINTIFGNSTLLLNENQPVHIKAESAFGNAELPGNSTGAFGEVKYETPGIDPDSSILYVQSDVVFGNFELKLIK